MTSGRDVYLERLGQEAKEKVEDDYDVVIDTLQQKIDLLWKMTQSNMEMGMMNMMDDIRLAHIDELRLCLRFWKHRKEALAVGDTPEPLWDK